MLNYTQKPNKLKKALCTFIFLFFNAQNYSCCSKISKRFTRESQMGTRESQNGHSGLLKWLVSLVISKLALLPILRLPLAHLRLSHEPFSKFSSQQEKFSHRRKRKINLQSTIPSPLEFNNVKTSFIVWFYRKYVKNFL